MPRLLVQILTLLTLVYPIGAAQSAPSSLELGAIRETHVPIPMRDGKRLSAYLYFPPGDGPWPVIFEQRYASLAGASTRKAAARLAEGGYVVAMVNFRGTGLSQGHYVGYRALQWGELRDGYDVCEWLGSQGWSTGKVGTFGSSQGGYAQNYLAVTQPPSLVCQYMIDTGLSLFHEGYRIGGTTRPERFKGMARVCRDPKDNDAVLAEWFAHPHYDDYWRAEDCALHFDKMNVPCLTVGSWFDFMNHRQLHRTPTQGRPELARQAMAARRPLAARPLQQGREGRRNAVPRERRLAGRGAHAALVRLLAEGREERRE